MNILSGLTVAFVVLKVLKIIDWNWFIIVSPAIIEVLIFGFLVWIFKKLFED